MNLLRLVFGCRHLDAVREHREDGWYLSCHDCGHAHLLNPRDRQMPTPVGHYDERKALAGKARAEKAAAQRMAVAVRQSEGVYAKKERANVLPIRQAR